MTLKVIGAGFGRTATMSLRMALDELGLGPCYHMEAVLNDMDLRLPHWLSVLEGKADWDTTFAGFGAAVDWPTAAYVSELTEKYPEAKVILSTRDAERWYDSISQTILAVLTSPDKWPPEQKSWLEMVHRVVIGRSLGGNTDKDSVIAAFKDHEAAIKQAIPADKLLVFEAREGWEPLCNFLGTPVPDTSYPRSNSREEFFALLAGEG